MGATGCPTLDSSLESFTNLGAALSQDLRGLGGAKSPQTKKKKKESPD